MYELDVYYGDRQMMEKQANVLSKPVITRFVRLVLASSTSLMMAVRRLYVLWLPLS